MRALICLLVTLGVAYGTSIAFQPNCANVLCTMDLKVCRDGTPAPVPAGGCCPSLSACKDSNNNAIKPIKPIKPISNCAFTMCTMVFLVCPDGTPAPVPVGGCCPSLSACKNTGVASRSNPLGSLGSLLSGSNLLQSLTSATHGTDLGTVLSIVNLLNNVHQLSNDIHQIPHLINQTLASILNSTGQVSQIVVDQLIGAVSGTAHQSRNNLLGALGQNAGLLSTISHLLPQGTSISSILSILSLLNNVNQLNNDIHQIPVLLNQTLTTLVGGAGQATQIIVDQLIGLVTPHATNSRNNLLGALGQNAGLLSTISHLLPQGTSISSILSILSLLNNVNQLNNDIHQIPVLLNQTLTTLVGGAGQATQIIVDQLIGLVTPHVQPTSRNNILGALGQNANLLSTISHLLPQGTSISTVLSLLNLLNNVNALNTDLHQIPAVLQETLQNILNGIQNVLPSAN
ncbi:unnamed protein product [Adineta ricciae]|uniref:Uncharacterized protein n=1 Tax=Adineta ricciae TaxID=249248 RepID=A0A814ZD59_ADIRI|nr:unnamed protein product [Adineta ricciae]